MAFQNVGGALWFPSSPPTNVSGGPSLTTTSFVLNAAGDKVAFLPITAPKTGNIRKIMWKTSTVTTGDTVDVRLETVDPTTGDPTGTLFGTTTNGAQVVASVDDNVMFATTLTADAAVTIGASKFAVVIVNGSVPGVMQIGAFADSSTGMTSPYVSVFAAAAWSKTALGPIVGFEYDDGSYVPVPGCQPYSAINTHTYNNGTTPDVHAMKFRLPFPAQAVSWWLWVDLDGDATIKLYDTDGVSVLGSAAIDKDERVAATGGGIHYGTLSAVCTLALNTDYYLGVEPSTATNLSAYSFDVSAAAQMDAIAGGQLTHYASAKDPSGVGSWTAIVTRRLFGGVGLSAFSDGVGAGGGLLGHPGMSGGFSG